MPERLHEYFRNGEWQEIRLDIDPSVEPDIVASITDMAVVESESMDGLWSSHNLEHLYPHEVPLALSEFHRVLKKGGILLMTLPDLQSVAQLIAQDKLEEAAYVSPSGPIAPIDILYGFRPSMAEGNLYMAHRTGFTARSLTNHLAKVGFIKGRVWRDEKAFALWTMAERTV
jgi:SAM-dependent methyltransferase